ncbi:hypothetical protein B566_EDAN008128 [Ephemera danica]|nr:hypothetical protein B566_EDAN008128 [Ephemera danica]
MDKFSFRTYLRNRETGNSQPLGYTDAFSKKLYSTCYPYASWNNANGNTHGGVYNLEFSPDGSLLVAACEKECILMFDPLNMRQLGEIRNAHQEGVNYIRFLDNRTFASCSDDSTVALWDARNLKSSVRTLHGHCNWVKNIEYSEKDSLLVTSGFDGSIYTWDINSSTEEGFVYNRVFKTTGLMRTRLTPDSSKMLISTLNGYIIVIHDLDLSTLAHDLDEFNPNVYRIMQLSNITRPEITRFNHLFSSTRKTNRLEFIDDFPLEDEAEIISSLQMHPQGLCVLSRNVSHKEKSEGTMTSQQ